MEFIVTIDSRYSLPIQNKTSKLKMYNYFCLGIGTLILYLLVLLLITIFKYSNRQTS